MLPLIRKMPMIFSVRLYLNWIQNWYQPARNISLPNTLQIPDNGAISIRLVGTASIPGLTKTTSRILSFRKILDFPMTISLSKEDNVYVFS